MRSAWLWWNVVSLNFKVRGLPLLMNSRTNLGTRLLARSGTFGCNQNQNARLVARSACYGSEKTGAPGENTVHSASPDRTSRALRSASRISAPKSATCLRQALGCCDTYLSLALRMPPCHCGSGRLVLEGAGYSRRSGGARQRVAGRYACSFAREEVRKV